MINCGKQTWLSLEGAQQSNSYIVVGTGAGTVLGAAVGVAEGSDVGAALGVAVGPGVVGCARTKERNNGETRMSEAREVSG